VHEIRIRAKWPDARTDELWRAIMGLAANDLKLQIEDVNKAVDDVMAKCPGSFRVLDQSEKADFIYLNRNATKGYISARILAAQ
jgi:hypothetical protein